MKNKLRLIGLLDKNLLKKQKSEYYFAQFKVASNLDI
jgi:hypothetical protein